LNRIILKGRVAKDPDVKTTQSGQTFTRLTIAVDRYTKAGEERKADFIPCTAWGNTAQFLAKYFQKGKEILAEGRIQTDSYTDKDGKKVYTTYVVIDRVEFCGSSGAKNATTTDAEEVPF
jgi:single-strand DNA-binding protein